MKQLLVETDWPLAEVAERCGFKHAEYMSVVFKQKARQTPAQFRRRRGGPGCG